MNEWLTWFTALNIYILKYKMESVSLTISCNFSMKLSHILVMVFLSIDPTTSSIIFFPESWFKLIVSFVLLANIFLFNKPKNNSTGANSGAYDGKNAHDQFLLFKLSWTSRAQWTEELSIIMQILLSSRPIICSTL